MIVSLYISYFPALLERIADFPFETCLFRRELGDGGRRSHGDGRVGEEGGGDVGLLGKGRRQGHVRRQTAYVIRSDH